YSGMLISSLSNGAGDTTPWWQNLPSNPNPTTLFTTYGQLPSPISTTQTFYNDHGQVVETDDAAGERTGTIYYPDGSVEYTGMLGSWLSNGTDGNTPW